MRRLSIAVLLVACGAFVALASDDVVQTAREAKAKRRKSSSKVLTNSDVKKSKGKVGSTNAPATPIKSEPTLMETHQASRAALALAAARKAAAEILIADLEKELASIEQRYYEESDLHRRDTEIVRRFNDVRSRLDTARDELAALGPRLPAESPGPATGSQ